MLSLDEFCGSKDHDLAEVSITEKAFVDMINNRIRVKNMNQLDSGIGRLPIYLWAHDFKCVIERSVLSMGGSTELLVSSAKLLEGMGHTAAMISSSSCTYSGAMLAVLRF